MDTATRANAGQRKDKQENCTGKLTAATTTTPPTTTTTGRRRHKCVVFKVIKRATQPVIKA